MRRRRSALLVAALCVSLGGAAAAHDPEPQPSETAPAPEAPTDKAPAREAPIDVAPAGEEPDNDSDFGLPEEPLQPADKGTTRLGEVLVEARKPVSAASSDDISYETFQLRPHATLQEILNNVPGLIVRQHQGGGKATQYLIRGFNADHGTDFLVMEDGMPVNLPSHGHGQGYADSNFIIPETIETLQLRKGPYFPELGDFAVAGALNLVTKEEFAENFALAEGGSFDRMRYVAGLSPKLGNVKTLIAGQAYYSNGPFENPEHFARYNAYAKFTLDPTPDVKAWLAGTFYAADWDASGQIPQRLVSAGTLDRFGSVDPTEGGRSDRENLDAHFTWHATPKDDIAMQLYGSRYKLRLWSDFTFFQDSLYPDPQGDIVLQNGPDKGQTATLDMRGDGLEQNDFRWIYGSKGHWTHAIELAGLPIASTIGWETRGDAIDVAVYKQSKRNRYFNVSKVHILENSYSWYLAEQIIFTDWLRFEGGMRGDTYTFDVNNRLQPQKPLRNPNVKAVPIQGYKNDTIVNPKANLIVSPEPDTDLYLNFGTGFHSNDARGIVQAKDSPDNVPLPRALGYEFGARTRKFDRLDVAAAVWLLQLESEVVFCGDCGTLEDFSPATASSFRATSGKTRRWGVDFETRYRILDWLTADYDLSYADPRFLNGDAIPIAPTLFMNGGLTAEFRNGFAAAFRVRYLDDRPAIEDRSLPARGYLIMDMFGRYRWRNVEVGIDFLNIGDFDWQEAVFADTSCTRKEAKAGRCPQKPDIHFTPGDPFGVRGRVTVFF